MKLLKVLWPSIVVVIGVMLMTGCKKDPTSPGVQPETTNNVDSFQYQVTKIRNYTNTVTYAWQNTGTKASVNQATTFTGGSATLALFDANGAQVYSRSLAENGTFTSVAGVSGSWTIRVTYSAASCTVNFRVQKET